MAGLSLRTHIYYSTDDGAAWKESGHTSGIWNGDYVYMPLDALGVPDRALVKIHAIVVGGKEQTGSPVFEYYNDYNRGGRKRASEGGGGRTPFLSSLARLQSCLFFFKTPSLYPKKGMFSYFQTNFLHNHSGGIIQRGDKREGFRIFPIANPICSR